MRGIAVIGELDHQVVRSSVALFCIPPRLRACAVDLLFDYGDYGDYVDSIHFFTNIDFGTMQ